MITLAEWQSKKFPSAKLGSASFKQTLIGAVNLGNQASTLGGLCASVAAIYYGYESIPKTYLEQILKKDYLLEASLRYENVLKIL